MMEDNSLYAAVWGMCLILLLTLIFSIWGYNTKELDTLARVVEAGHSPSQARCILDLGGDDPVCVIKELRDE